MRTLALTLVLLFTTAAASAQTKIYLITIGPGSESYEKFGHNMIWIHDPANQLDVLYNWGVFDFAEHNFIWRFIQGRMTYHMLRDIENPYQPRGVIDFYTSCDRSIWTQELNLSPRQIQSILETLPATLAYKYDYYRDNCSTRVRDTIDGALNGQIKSQLQNIPTGTTYRWHTRRLTQDDWWLYVALNYIMGHPIDHPISAWEECFLPVQMMERLRTLKIKDESGNEVPLVIGEQTVYQSKSLLEHDRPPRHAIWIFGAIGMVLGALMTMLARGKRRWIRISFPIIVVAWAFLSGLAGTISTYVWLCTDHLVGRYNENWLQLNPITMALVVLVPAMFLGKQWGARHIALLAAAMSIIGFVAKIFPVMYQVNGEIIALALPANIGMAWGVWMIWRKTSTAAVNKPQV